MNKAPNSDYKFLQGGGEMGDLIRRTDWSKTPIGDVSNWPAELKIATGIMLATPFPMYIAWGKDYIQLYNDGYRPILGATKHPQALGISTRETFTEIWHIIGPMFSGVMEGKAVGFPNFMLPLERNGYVEECFFDFSYSPISDEEGNIGGVLVTVIETTEKVQSLKALNLAKESLELSVLEKDKQRDELKKFFMEAPGGICILDGENFVFELVNAEYQKMLPRDLLNKPLFEALPELKGQPLQKLLEDVYRTGVSVRVLEEKIPVADYVGGPLIDRYFNFTYQARLGNDGKPNGILVFVNEVTEIVAAKNQLSASADLLKSQLNALPVIAWISNINGEVDFYNQKWFDYTGLTFEQTKAWGWKEVIHPDDLEFNLASYSNILQGTTGGEFEIRERDIKGVFRWHAVRMMPVKGANGDILQWVGTATDIHEFKDANEKLALAYQQLASTIEALSVSERNFSGIILQAPVAMGLFLGEEMKLEIVNDKFLDLWGKDASVRGKTLMEALPELQGQPYLQIMVDVYNTGEPYFGNEAEVALVKNGKLERGFYNFINHPFFNAEGKITGIIVVALEVTTQVIARNELGRAYEQARLSKEAAQLGTFDMELEAGTMHWDDRCRTLFGISHHDAVSYEKDFVSGLHPEDRDRITQIINNEVMDQSFNNGNYDVEYRTIGVEDKKLRWVRAKGKVYFDPAGKPQRFIGSVLDITEQKLDEQRKNDFIGMVSHELKTPLTSLSAIIQLLNSKLRNSEDQFLGSAAEKAAKQVKKMVDMINGFLNLSRLESGKMIIHRKPFPIASLIKETIDDIRLTSPAHQLIFEESSPTVVIGDRDKLTSVVSNLLSNAVKYSPKGRTIDVKSTASDNEVTISVKDEGMGIKPQDIAYLFDRYYRVENENTAHISGFGIGLYLSSEIVKAHGGKIWAESQPGSGSTFFFTLPVFPPSRI